MDLLFAILEVNRVLELIDLHLFIYMRVASALRDKVGSRTASKSPSSLMTRIRISEKKLPSRDLIP